MNDLVTYSTLPQCTRLVQVGLSSRLRDNMWDTLSGSLTPLLAPGVTFTGEREQGEDEDEDEYGRY
jgi:hypothetical protein